MLYIILSLNAFIYLKISFNAIINLSLIKNKVFLQLI